jgi:hypothetical protein
MKKTYRHSRRSNKTRVTKNYTARRVRRVRRVHKAHKSHRIQKGGNYNYELDVSTTSDVIFVTRKIRPRIIYRIDLPSKTFSIFTSSEPYETYPLEKVYDRTLLKILSNAKRNDPLLDELLVSHGINNIGYYTGDEDFVRDRKKNYKQELHQIEESEEEFLAKSPKAVVEQVDVLQEIPRISPKASPKASPKGSLHSKTVKNKLLSRRTREGLRQAMNLAAVITDDKVKHLRDGDVRVKTVAPRVVGPSFRLPSRDRLPFKP